jgi:hypothetical protein
VRAGDRRPVRADAADHGRVGRDVGRRLAERRGQLFELREALGVDARRLRRLTGGGH